MVLEALQFVYFGGLFQRMNSFQFGSLIFGIATVAFIAWSAFYRLPELKRALAQPRLLIAINVTATFAWAAYLGAVQLIEPAVAYTIGAGVMPLASLVAWRLGWPEAEGLTNPVQTIGVALIALGTLALALILLTGNAGFTRGGFGTALAGLALAIADGVFFTWLLFLCGRLNDKGVGPGTVFGLRFPMYVVVSGLIFTAGYGGGEALPNAELLWITALGLLLVVPPLYALQRAVAQISTLAISLLTAIGPFLIFALQIVEGRVALSTATLAGLCLYFLGALVAAWGQGRSNSAT